VVASIPAKVVDPGADDQARIGNFWLRSYSPGLATAVLYSIVMYFFARYGYVAGMISVTDFWIAVVTGALVLGGFLTVGPTALFPWLYSIPPITLTLRV